MEAISREFRVALPWELLYADDLAVIAETEEELIKRLNEWKENVESKGMRVNMNKTKVVISGERQMVWQKAARWPCGVCNKGVGSNSLQCTRCQKWVHKKCSLWCIGGYTRVYAVYQPPGFFDSVYSPQ